MWRFTDYPRTFGLQKLGSGRDAMEQNPGFGNATVRKEVPRRHLTNLKNRLHCVFQQSQLQSSNNVIARQGEAEPEAEAAAEAAAAAAAAAEAEVEVEAEA